MRYLHGLIVLFGWVMLMKLYLNCGGMDIPNNLQILTSSIVLAGALAGGDGYE